MMFSQRWSEELRISSGTLVSCFSVFCSAYSSTLLMWATCSSEAPVDFQRTTWHHIPEDITVCIHKLLDMKWNTLCLSNNFLCIMWRWDLVAGLPTLLHIRACCCTLSWSSSRNYSEKKRHSTFSLFIQTNFIPLHFPAPLIPKGLCERKVCLSVLL
jgi:hypothetical protein